MKTVNYNNEELRLVQSTYYNGNLYVGLVDLDDENNDSDETEIYADVTVNLPNSGTLPSDCAYIDTNNMPGIDDVLVREGIATPIHQSAYSGFCKYYVYRFNLTDIDKL